MAQGRCNIIAQSTSPASVRRRSRSPSYSWRLTPLPLNSIKSNWQKLRGSNFNISAIKGKWQPSFLLDLLKSSPFSIMNAIPRLSWWHFMGDENLPTPLFFCEVKNFISGNKWAKVSSSPSQVWEVNLVEVGNQELSGSHRSPQS